MYPAAKRLLDIVLSSLGLIGLSPVLLLAATVVRFDSPGPVLYQGTRIGEGGKPFKMLKFRTMVVNADKIGGSSTAGDDPRITRSGKWLRKYKADELPQLLNVLRGEMSIVGPRPEVPHYVDMFTDEERAILSVKPGITDWASIWNSDEGAILAGSADPERTYMEQIRPEKMRLQMEYVRRRSMLVDLRIILETVTTIVADRHGRD